MSSVSDPTPSGEDRAVAQPTTREIPVIPAGGATPSAPSAPPSAPGAARSAPGAPALPPHPGALQPAPVAPPEQPAAPPGWAPGFNEPNETGPVNFVPGLPGVGTSGPPLPAAEPEPTGATAAAVGAGSRTWPDTLEADASAAKAPRAPQDRTALLGIGLAVLALLLLELGLGLSFGDRSFWSLVPLWSAFATVAALLALVGFAPATLGRRGGPGNAARGAGATGSGLPWRIAAGGLVGLAVFWLLVVLPHADTNRGFVLTAALGALGAGLWMGPARSR